MAVYECFVITTTTTIIIRAVRALEGWKGTKPCRFSRMFKFDEVEPSRFNPHHWCPLSPYQLPLWPGSLLLSSTCQLGTGIPWGFSREEPELLRMWVKLTELSWMWAEGRESSDLQPRPSLSGSDSLHRAVLWFGIATLSFVHRALWDLWAKVPLLCHFKNTAKALKLNVLGSAIGNRICPLPETWSPYLSLDLLAAGSGTDTERQKKEIFPNLHVERCTKGSALIVFKILCWTEGPHAFPSEVARQSLRGTGVQALLSSPKL